MKTPRSRIFKLIAFASLLTSVNSAYAHVVAEPQEVTADSYQKLSFRITHGCEGSPTKAVTIYIPEAFHGAKPMPKAGWSIDMESQPLAQPYQSHGKLIKEEVRAITWKGGSLPNEYFDEFAIQVRIGTVTGQIAIPVTQLCESGRLDWNEVATPDKTRDKLEAPAPIINVHPAAGGMAHHQH